MIKREILSQQSSVHWPNLNNIKMLMSSKSEIALLILSKYIYELITDM